MRRQEWENDESTVVVEERVFGGDEGKTHFFGRGRSPEIVK